MPLPPYSPDLAASDYHLFHSLQNHLIQCFAPKNQTFYESGNMKLTERWQKVIEQNGQYIIDKCLLFVINELALKIMKKKEITLFPTQYIILCISKFPLYLCKASKQLECRSVKQP